MPESDAAKLNGISLRRAEPDDQEFLREMLWHCLFVPPGAEPFAREILALPEISRYVAGWGKPDDYGLIATDEATRQDVGAVWVRLMKGEEKGYGYVDAATPELSIALLPEYRGQGIGTTMMKHLITELPAEYLTLSLSVSRQNPARCLYERLGFSVVEEEGDSIIMLLRRERTNA